MQLNYEKTVELRSKIWNAQSWFKPGIRERSDLIYCPFKPYNRDHGVKSDPPTRAIPYWVIGEALHVIIQRAFKLTEINKPWSGINVRHDIMWDRPAEIKTTRQTLLKPSHIPEYYLKQIEVGMLSTNRNDFYLITLDMRNNMLLVWDVFGKNQILARRSRYYKTRLNTLERMIATKDMSLLEPHIPECEWCEYMHTCPYRKWKKLV